MNVGKKVAALHAEYLSHQAAQAELDRDKAVTDAKLTSKLEVLRGVGYSVLRKTFNGPPPFDAVGKENRWLLSNGRIRVLRIEGTSVVFVVGNDIQQFTQRLDIIEQSDRDFAYGVRSDTRSYKLKLARQSYIEERDAIKAIRAAMDAERSLAEREAALDEQYQSISKETIALRERNSARGLKMKRRDDARRAATKKPETE